MPPESLTLLSQGGPFVALLGLMAWLVPLALKTHRDAVAEFSAAAQRFARESRLTRRALKRIGAQVDHLTGEVRELRNDIDDCPHHTPPHEPPSP